MKLASGGRGASPKLVRPAAGTVPDEPGVYHFKDGDGRIIYVGKAKSLKSRLSSYFGDLALLAPRTAQMMSAARAVDWISVDTEVEALLLEYSLIQRHQPRFNIRYRDDKSYPFLALTLADEWPRAMVVRGKKKPGNRYFGPFGHAYAIRETLDLLLRTFPIRTCSDNKFNRHARLGRPCLLFHIEKCAGPCVGEVAAADYAEMTAHLIQFLEGDTDELVSRLKQEMETSAADLNFELAARWRDRLSSVEKAAEKQQMVDEKREDFDMIGICGNELETAVQVFFVRKGKVLGRRGFIIDKAEDLNSAQLMSRVLEMMYHEENPLGSPKRVYVPEMPENLELYTEWLSQQRGSQVSISVAQRGAKRTLAATVERNAEDSFTRHRLKRASDHNSRARALNDLAEHLNLPEAPLRIECYDMSHLQGSDYVGSMVVMEDGLPRKKHYRHFRLRHVEANNDFAAMEEVLRRRLENYLAEMETESSAAERESFAYPPGLLLVDGGKGQLGVAERVVRELGLSIPVAALAKEFEEVFIVGRRAPVAIPRGSEGLYLLQRIRDESHRFAVSYHRKLRGKRMTKSALDDIAGLGPARKQRLAKELGGVRAVQSASLEDLAQLSWLPEQVALAVHEKFNGENDSNN